MHKNERHLLWNQMLERYRATENAVNGALIENIEALLFHPEIEYIRQGIELLHSLGSEQLCRYLRKRHGQVVLQKPKKGKWKKLFLIELRILEIVMEDEAWKPLYNSGLFKGMEFRVMGDIEYSKLPEQLKRKSVNVSREMVLIPAGEFWMGAHPADQLASKVEKPRHRVKISKDFYTGKYLITQALWELVTGKNPSYNKGALRPVECVNWLDCIRFCNQLSLQQGKHPVYTINGDKVSCNWEVKGYRLLTEAEWEYAARGKGGDISTAKARLKGGTVGWEYAARAPALHSQGARAKDLKYAARAPEEFKYSGSNNPDEVGWYQKNRKQRAAHSVGLKNPNGFGLYDMSGNVLEWVWDLFYSSEYEERADQAPIIDPVGARVSDKEGSRILRGGAWSSPERCLQVSYRLYNKENHSNRIIGFRVALPNSISD